MGLKWVTYQCVFLPGDLEFGLLKDGRMKRARFTEEPIIAILRERDAVAKIADLVRKRRELQ
jgi:hypothetical protein